MSNEASISRSSSASRSGDRTKARLLVISGLSGSGKSTAANALEDIGYYCVDNLPLPLLKTFLADPLAQVGDHRKKLAVVTDVRAPGSAEVLPKLLEGINRQCFELTVVFLEATEEALLRRYSETRRSHPIGIGERPVIDGIRREKHLLAALRGRADLIFDTSDWSVHDVRREIYKEFADGAEGSLTVSLVSFGFKHGIPAGSDLVLDVRFLPNPYFNPDLRQQSGQDRPVQEFLEAEKDFRELRHRLEDLLGFLLPRYQRENRSYLSLAIGCTGGRHRSVAMCESLADSLGRAKWRVRLRHRDLDRGG
ncbi:MAG: RNase adapter RapZ [bacterium]|nr:RNase adapter RapZ [bacterium]